MFKRLKEGGEVEVIELHADESLRPTERETEPVGAAVRVPVAALTYLEDNGISQQRLADAAQKVCNLLIDEFDAHIIPMVLVIRFVEAAIREKATRQFEEGAKDGKVD